MRKTTFQQYVKTAKKSRENTFDKLKTALYIYNSNLVS